MMVKLSIITINFNDGKGLQKTIESVINQTFKNYEYIVIDGGSKDDSVDVIKKYENQISYWVSEKDKGIYNAMNKGLRQAHGEYCLFLNSGDFLASNIVLKELFSFTPNQDIVSAITLSYDNKRSFLHIPPKNISLYTFSLGSLPHPSTIIRTQMIQDMGGYLENYKIVSDWCFFIEALIVNNCSYRTVDVVLTKFNRYGISTTSPDLGEKESIDFLTKRFPRIYKDYTDFLYDEAASNILLYIKNKKLRPILLFFPRVFNRLLKLRNTQSCRIGFKRIK